MTVLQGLQYFREQGKFALRCLSTKNIFLTNSNEIKIVDPFLFNTKLHFKRVF